MFAPVYLDHNATTPLDPAVREAMLPWLGERYGNASSRHEYSRAARRAIDEARHCGVVNVEHLAQFRHGAHVLPLQEEEDARLRHRQFHPRFCKRRVGVVLHGLLGHRKKVDQAIVGIHGAPFIG